MKLSEFCQAFKNSYNGARKSNAAFFEMLISGGLTSSEIKDQLSEISRKQKEELFSGKANPYDFSLKYKDFFGPDTFNDWLLGLGNNDDDSNHDDIVDSLCLHFKEFIPQINKDNYAELLTKTLTQILKNNAKIAEENKSKKFTIERNALFKKQNGKCFLCGQELTLQNGQPNSLKITKQRNSKDNETAAICPTCYQEIKDDKKREKELNEKNPNNFKFNYDLTNKDLIDIISKLEKMNDTELRTQLNYAGLKISEKINKEIYPGLFKKISNYVATYYPMMQQIFSEYDGEEGRSFDRLACNIRSLFLQVFENEKDPIFIYDSIVNEVQKKTGKTRFIAEIIVAFFIQNCEVLDAISK